MRAKHRIIMKITKREIIASIVIIFFMLIIGFIISDKITDSVNDKNAEYQKAVQISDSELFQYGMDTNVGNAFVYGDLESVDTVTYPEISGEYMYVEKIKEEYTRHTRTVSDYDKDGKKIGEHEEEYWTWDAVEWEDSKSQEVTFCGIVFDSNKIDIPSAKYIDAINVSSHTRFQYYGVETKHTGTIYTDLRNKTISDNTQFYKDCTIEQTLEKCTSSGAVIIFWVIWIALIAGLVYGFYYLDNNWLEDK